MAIAFTDGPFPSPTLVCKGGADTLKVKFRDGGFSVLIETAAGVGIITREEIAALAILFPVQNKESVHQDISITAFAAQHGVTKAALCKFLISQTQHAD